MGNKMRNIKVLALFSGGLDSMLSVLWMRRLGYEVIPIFFQSYFFSAEKASKIAESIGFKLEVIDIGEKLLEIIKNPRYGFGGNMNPCIDCHALMFREAGAKLQEYGASFIVSGEVLGQRPMSQRLNSMKAVSKHSGYRDLIIRPLSQKLLPDSLPIINGLVNKSEMLDIQGRSRQRQMQMAKEFGVKEYSTPGGGCSLTDKGYTIRLRDLLENQMLGQQYIKYLRNGRHFRLSNNCKLIVGKNINDNQALLDLSEDETMLRIVEHPGPVGVLNCINTPSESELEFAASIVLTFSRREEDSNPVAICNKHNIADIETMPEKFKIIKADKLYKDDLESCWIKMHKKKETI